MPPLAAFQAESMVPFNVFYNVQTLDILRWNTTSAGQHLTLRQKVSTPVGCTPVCLRPPRRVCLCGTRGVGVIWLPTHNAHVSYMPDLMRVWGVGGVADTVCYVFL